MKKEYIRDKYGHISLCSSNIAKMNIFESMYYHRLWLWMNIKQTINDLINYWYIIENVFMILIIPLWYPGIALWKIHVAKKEMKNK